MTADGSEYEGDHRERIVGVLSALDELPTLAPVVYRVRQLASDPESSVEELAQVILTDASLTAKLLRFANSPFYGLIRRITTVREAIVVVGYERVLSALVAVAVIDALGSARQWRWFADLWRHSFATAGVARYLGRLALQKDVEEIFIAGLLHDVGKAVFGLVMPEDYEQCLSDATPERNLIVLERERFGIHHGELGARLLVRWNLPLPFVVAAESHHDPRRHGPHALLLSIIHLASEAVARAGEPVGTAPVPQIEWAHISESIPIDAASFDALIGIAATEIERARAFLAAVLVS